MPTFNVGQSIETATPTVEVTVDENNPLLPGVYTFELRVQDDAGNISAPVQAQVVVVDPGPTAVISAPREVDFAASFNLSGEGSSDIGDGVIEVYRWTLVDGPN